MGRKRVELDWSVVDTTCFYGATTPQLKFLLEKKGVTLTRKSIEAIIKREKGVTFSEYRETQHCGAKFKLAQKQFEVAMSGNPSLLIFLGKNWLGQSDKIDNEQRGELKIKYEALKNQYPLLWEEVRKMSKNFSWAEIKNDINKKIFRSYWDKQETLGDFRI